MCWSSDTRAGGKANGWIYVHGRFLRDRSLSLHEGVIPNGPQSWACVQDGVHPVTRFYPVAQGTWESDPPWAWAHPLSSLNPGLEVRAGLPCGSVVKNSGDAGDVGLIPGSGRSPGEEHGNPLQYSYLGNSMDRGAWWAPVHRIAKELDTPEWLNKNEVGAAGECLGWDLLLLTLQLEEPLTRSENGW